jgi:uncharacterized coiled-coil protein SlyX
MSKILSEQRAEVARLKVELEWLTHELKSHPPEQTAHISSDIEISYNISC